MFSFSLPRSSPYHRILKHVLQRFDSLIYALPKKEQIIKNTSGEGTLNGGPTNPDNLEEYLLKLCQEFEQSNKVIQIKSLYLRARRETKIPRLKIETAIHNLILSKKIIPGRFLHTQSVLKNTNRKKIYDLIASRPASQALDLKTKTGLGAKILAWHLKQLLDFKQIQQVNFISKMLFTLPGQDDREAIAYYIISRNNIDRYILATLIRKPTSKSILNEQDTPRRTTFLYHLNNLEQWKMIERVNAGEDTYQVTANFRDSILRVFQKFYPSELQLTCKD